MIDKRMSDKGIQFELSMGNAGNTLDGQIQSAKADETDASVREDLGKNLECLSKARIGICLSEQ